MINVYIYSSFNESYFTVSPAKSYSLVIVTLFEVGTTGLLIGCKLK